MMYHLPLVSQYASDVQILLFDMEVYDGIRPGVSLLEVTEILNFEKILSFGYDYIFNILYPCACQTKCF